MAASQQHRFSGPVTVFQERRLPEPASPAGYSALIDTYGLAVPLPRTLSATGERHRITQEGGWRIMTPRHAPHPTLEGHLTFALKYEGLDLAVLKRLFQTAGPGPVEELVRDKPTGSYARRIWFLYEWLTGSALNLPDAQAGRYVTVLDPELQWGTKGETAPRYRLKNNLPGTPDFCPLVFRTETLSRFIDLDLPQRALDVVADVPRDVLARTAAFLLLKDSRSSYAIEGERPPQDRIQRWGRAIGEAGRQPLDHEELLRLQRIVIGDGRFVKLGFRDEGGFVGEHDRETRMPLPDHISARHEDLQSLIDGMIAFDRNAAQALDPVIAAAILAFGFVYIHPFEDGNGRIHRYLIHHVLAERGFNPPGVVFPVSAAILEQIDDYKQTLESYSGRLLPLIEWEPTEKFNVRVLNETGDFYRFFDATPHAEFLYGCVQRTVEEDLPNEAGFLRRYDEFRSQVESFIDMPERTIDLLFRFLQQNDGRLSNRAREKEFAELTDAEAERIEAIYSETFAPKNQVEGLSE
ncbi:Fic family protein [Oceanibacterium hippocampi]|uniref:Fic/DOC family protein n=1 Tax=Oceanibacterium hippocampi TaxID=745714 RepID=A0A1Y5U050_9PROT|nr:Fic family protein [Oceanibacterium hippocampi]SLN77859.1 Fic/DOC family protein [Oceanibacterium hippocampi]